jgi:two-component system NtrC family response regulator
MKPKQNTILVVDDDVSLANTLKDFLQEQGYSAVSAFSGDEALAAQRDNVDICVALVDLMMPFMDGLTLMEQLHKQDPELAVVIMTGFGTIETAVEAMKRGAEDYITKPFEREAVRRKIGRLMELFELRSRVQQLEANLQEGRGSFESLIFVSPAMQKVVEKARTAAGTEAPVLVLGETGTGKEKLARAIHATSARASGPFIAVNCGALPRELVESELFGFRRGAFTGAYCDVPGIFASARGGTVFLDEIGEMPKETQVKLLRVLQEKELRPVGSAKSVTVDARIISSTNRPHAVLRSEFLREDFYFRIATVVLEIPPLRQRSEDILVLAQHFAREASDRYDRQIELSRSAFELLLRHTFPGNIRELQNLIESAAAVSKEDPQTITEKDLKPLFDTSVGPSLPCSDLGQTLALDELERKAVERALRLAQGNRTKAAALLGISRDTLYRKLRDYNPARV